MNITDLTPLLQTFGIPESDIGLKVNGKRKIGKPKSRWIIDMGQGAGSIPSLKKRCTVICITANSYSSLDTHLRKIHFNIVFPVCLAKYYWFNQSY